MELISALSVETILEFQVIRRLISVKTTSKARDNAALFVRRELKAGNFEMTTPDKEEMPTDRTEGQFRKKPVVVDAVQLRQRFLWPDWFHDAVSSNVIITHGLGKYGTGPVYCEIKTLEGVMRANAGDWVVRGTQGEIYPCKPDIFIEIYEPVGIATAFNAYEPMREALSKIANCGQSQEPDHWQFRVMARDTSNAALSTLPVNDRQTSDDVGILRALLEEELVWHEERDKSLSKQPQSNQVVWRRAEHQERIDVIRAALKGVPQPATPKEAAMTEAQIKHMVDRFLMWKLPEHFNPDDGISFDPVASKGTPYEFRRSL